MGATITTSYHRTNHINQSIEMEELTIDVLPGWKEGTKITFNNCGDIIYCIKQKPHDTFKRIDNDLMTVIDLSYDEALNGFEKDIIGIDGLRINIRSNNGINGTNDIYKISGKGMSIRKQGKFIGYGDMLVGFNIRIKPKNESGECAIWCGADVMKCSIIEKADSK